MKNFLLTSVSLFVFTLLSVHASAELKTKKLGSGWVAFVQQSDPFDTSKVTIVQIIKDKFTFRCGELNMSADSYGYESLSFGAEIRYLIDNHPAQDKKGKYSTYLGGSDLVTDSRYYSFKISKEDIDSMKSGNTMKVAGKYGSSGWQTESINLDGFTLAYSQMCN
jgi:hypothetical protein